MKLKISDSNKIIDTIKQETLNSTKENGYLISGIFNREINNIQVREVMSLDSYSILQSNDRLILDKKFLYASLKAFSENEYCYILVHTHIYQNKDNLMFSRNDLAFIKDFLILSKKMKYNLPLLFGIIGIDAHLFKCYFNSNTLNIDLE